MSAQPDAFDSNNLPAPRPFFCQDCGAHSAATCSCPPANTPDPRNVPRTDPHREGAIIPSDYTPVLSFGHFTHGFGFHVNCEREYASYNLDAQGNIVGVMPGTHSTDPTYVCCLARARSRGLRSWEHPRRSSSSSNCDVCGAYFMHGALWHHNPTGECIYLGHDCEDKYGMTMDRSAWLAWHANQTRLRSIAAKTKKYRVAALKFLEKNPQLAEALALAEAQPQQGEFWGLRVLRDTLSKLNQYGALSTAQANYALKLAGEARIFVATPAPPVEPHVEAPEGRVTFRGTITGIKVVDNPNAGWGMPQSTTKMTVKVQEALGCWFCFVTMPSSISDAQRGAHVELTATLTRSDRDYYFAFGSRPTGARLI